MNTKIEQARLDIPIIVNSYLECAVWADKPEDEVWMVRFSDNAKIKSRSDCTQLYLNIQLSQISNNLMSIDLANKETLSHLGSDFWLTRNYHGAGFWDGNDYWSDEDGQELTRICQENFERLNVYVSEKSNQIEFEQG